jgi:hypothetical protein
MRQDSSEAFEKPTALGIAVLRTVSTTLALAGLLILAPHARGDFQTGQKLLESCTADRDSRASAFCVGYVAAIADVLGRGEEDISSWYACIPEDATQGQAAEAAIRWLETHADTRHYTAADLVAQSLAKAYPCAP